MRGGAAKASIFLLSTLGPAITHSLPTHQLSSDAYTQDDSVRLWRGFDGVYVQFEASCARCSSVDDEKGWPIDLFIGSNNGLCDNATVSVNGREITHQWEGRFAYGAGRIPSSPFNASSELQATWRSICVEAPLGTTHRRNAHIFTLTFENDRDERLEDEIGFTVSLGDDEEVEVLRVSNFPVSFGDGSAWETWSRPKDTKESEGDADRGSDSVSLEIRLETELQKLQLLHYELQQLQNSIALQESQIRRLLKQDCKPLLAKWQQCEDVFCYLKTSWQKLPEYYWSIRYRFGLLGSGKIIPICRPIPERPSDHRTNPDRPSAVSSSSHAVPSPSKHVTSTYSETISVSVSSIALANPTYSTTISTIPPAITPPPSHDNRPDLGIRPNHPDASATEVALPLHSPTKDFLRSCAILLLVILIFGLFFRVVGHTTTFLRRRRDLASRREELQARRAYRNAARRLRWRQWWEGRSYFQAASVTSSHSLPEFQHVRGVNQGDESNRLSSRGNNDSDDSYESDGANEEPEQRMMQAEILGLRRVLEYVGQLVGADGTPSATSSVSARRRNRSRSRSGPPPYEQITPSLVVVGGGRGNAQQSHHQYSHHHADIHRSATPGRTSASGAPSSPRASTMFSLENGSLVTLETLDTLESGTAPPSYHT